MQACQSLKAAELASEEDTDPPENGINIFDAFHALNYLPNFNDFWYVGRC